MYPKLDDDTISLSMQPENKLIENKSDEYFISDTSKYIYALVELDGEKRIKALGIKSEFYYDKEKAKAWRNNISKIIHPDTHSHPKATEAHARLNKLYESMIG